MMLSVSLSVRVKAQSAGGGPYFADTGHSVSGEFWSYYQSQPNASLVFGSPITEQFTDSRSGRLIQYFQRARFEYFPENPPGKRVVLSQLGSLVIARTPPQGAINNFNPLGCRYYSETGYSLCYAFLEFYDKNGGEAIFGKPISAFVSYNDRIVQYFERARMDWYPEYPEGQKISLAQLGRSYFDQVPEDANRLKPVRASNAPGNVKSLRTHTFTWKALTRVNDQQVVYVVVQDQTLNAVPDANVVVTVTWSDGQQISLAQNTAANGVAILPFAVTGQKHGNLIMIETRITFNGLTDYDSTSFRVRQ